MNDTIHTRLLNREISGANRYTDVRAIYGDRRWIRQLDIVDELEGHDGCVNALSWSKSGRLLASGSDDQRLNLHQYQPNDSSSSFKLATTVQTGHTANIFSVKFMPHSNDRTLVTAAGDSQIRVFDIEYSGRSSIPATAANIPPPDRLQGYLHNGTQFLRHTDTNARVYRSHSDRVKRIVTESSPYLFLSCSEDGEVRQWDLRQPSSAYPQPRGGRGWRSAAQDDNTGVPPPLISYKRYHLDLNTISCSPSQPHYIALGGAHLHAFLHDRRMLGRDTQHERGGSVSPSGYSDHDDDLLGEATQCVRRFAPHGQGKMKRSDNGHITACKISDARPNEMIVSWSGDFIYSFDLVQSPDARSEHEYTSANGGADKSKVKRSRSRDRKRKRAKESSVPSQEGTARAGSKTRRAASRRLNADDAALHVQYANGQVEEIPIRDSEETQESLVQASSLSEAEKTSYRIANTSVKIRTRMFALGDAKEITTLDPTGHAVAFTSALGFAASILQDMDDVIRSWGYPVDPDETEVVLQTTLRRNRESARRFVQASGTVARLLGGRLRTAASNQDRTMLQFAHIMPAPNETSILSTSEQFRYDFIKAIVLWLDSGVGALVDGFSSARNVPRCPLPQDAGVGAIDEKLIPYLMRLAGDRPIPNVDASRFEVDENRKLFGSERAAVVAFANALKIPFEDLSRAVSSAESDGSTVERASAQDRKTALKFWGFKVARGLLLMAGEGVNHAFIDRAFGGLGNVRGHATETAERRLDERLADVDPDEEEQLPSDDEMISVDHIVAEAARADIETHAAAHDDDNAEEDDDDDYYEEEEERDEHPDPSTSDDPGSDSASDDEESAVQSFLFRNAFSRSAMRTAVQTRVPCSPHTRLYRGHCNVKTVKDVNFFGLNDEYVVSGSDSGHIFIWDRTSTCLVNILEGDGEVVNVVQGHPYEPVLAASGIDHTIKIFSPDARARRDARNGVGVASVDPSAFSSLRFGRTRAGVPRRPTRPAVTTAADVAEPRLVVSADEGDDSDSYDDNDGPVGPSGLSSRKRLQHEYVITSQNDVDRQGGQREAFITRSMLAQLAARMRLQVVGAGNDRGGGLGLDGAGGGEDRDGDEAGTGDDDGDRDGDGDFDFDREVEQLGLDTSVHFDEQGRVVMREDCEIM